MKKTSTLRSAPAVLALSAIAFPCWPAAGPPQKVGRAERRAGRTFPVTETSLGKRPRGFIDYSLQISPVGNHIAYVVNHGSTKSVVLDGTEGKAYPDIPEQPLTERGRDPQIRFSPDGKRIAYVAHGPAGDFVVVDGIEGPPFEQISVGAPVFSPDSKRVAYIAGPIRKQTVVVDGIPDPPCDYVGAVPIRFSPDSKHIAYPAVRGKVTVAVMDGKDIDRGRVIGFIEFSNDGRHYAYTVLEGETRRVVIDGVSSKLYNEVGNKVVFSSDSKHVLYVAEGAGGNFLVVDGQEGKYRGIIRENDYEFSPGGQPVYLVDRAPGEIYVVIGQNPSGPYARVISMPRFSPDTRRSAFAVQHDDGKSAVVVDGAEGPTFDQIDLLLFSPRGNHLFYTATAAGKQYAVLDGKRTEYDAVPDAAFSPDGEHLALLAKLDGQWLVLTDNKPVKLCGSQVSQLQLTLGGKHLAFVCERNHHQVAVIDGLEGKPYDNIDQLNFSSGGVASYIATRNHKRIVVIDTIEAAEFDSVLTPLVFDGSSSLRFLAIKSGEYFREEFKLEK